MSNDNLSSIGNRMTGNTPPFWKKIRNIALVVTAVAGAVLAGAETGVELPDLVIQIAKYAIWATGLLTVAAQAANNQK